LVGVTSRLNGQTDGRPVSACSSCSAARSQTIRGLRGDGRDERFREIDHVNAKGAR